MLSTVVAVEVREGQAGQEPTGGLEVVPSMLVLVAVVQAVLGLTLELGAVPMASTQAVEGVPLVVLVTAEASEQETEVVGITLTVLVAVVLVVCREEVVAHLESQNKVTLVMVAEVK
jgi:hypothetical protein